MKKHKMTKITKKRAVDTAGKFRSKRKDISEKHDKYLSEIISKIKK